MKKICFAIASIVLCAVASVAQATPVLTADVTSTAVGDNYAIYLSTGDLNNTFGTIIVEIRPSSGEFLNFNATGTSGASALGPGSDATFTNALLAAPPLFGGEGFSVLDGGVNGIAASGPNAIGYNAGPLGANINKATPIFLNNVVLPAGGSGLATVQLVDTGVVVSTLSLALGGGDIIPEPTTLAMAGLSLIGLAFRRRMA